jgi:hypothetical protein
MRKTSWSLAISFVVSVVVLGCGGSGSSAGAPPPATLAGLASSDSPVASVSLKDSAAPRRHVATTPDSSGSFSFDVAALTPPFALKVQAASGAEYAIAPSSGVANVNPITTIAASAADESDDAEHSWSSGHSGSSDDVEAVIKSLSRVLRPLFDLYGIRRIGEDDEGGNLRALLRDVSFRVKSGVVTVTNRATGAVIFTGKTRDLASGTFHPENMPPGPGGGTPVTCTGFTYNPWGACQSNNTQTRTVATSSPSGCTGGAPVVSQSCVYTPPPPGACQYTYTSWGACQSNNTQTRTVVTSGPTGCTGTPVLSQSCTYVPPPVTCTGFTYNPWGACQSNNTQTRNVLTSSPTGCTGGTPVLSQSCIYVPPVVTCDLSTAIPSCSTCHGAIGSGSHANRALTCATCHGPVNNGTGTPSTGMAASLSGTTCRLTYPTSGTHENGTVNRGAAK